MEYVESMGEASHTVCAPCASCRHTKREELMETLAFQLSVQGKHMPAMDFMEKIQKHEMAPSWRKRIVEWMMEAASEFEMNIDTVACAVNLMDRYLSEFQADKMLLQLLAMVSLAVASKMHEPHPITMEEMDLLSRGKFNRCDIRDVEKQLLKVVNWQVNPPTAHGMARQLTCFIDQEEHQELMAEVLVILDKTMKDHSFVKYLPSTVAYSAIMVAFTRKRRVVNPWITMGVNALPWPNARLRDCQRAILGATQYVATPNDMEARTSRLSKMARSDSPTSAEEFERMVNQAGAQINPPLVMTPAATDVASVPLNSNKRMKIG